MPASHFDVNSMTGRPKFIVRHSTYWVIQNDCGQVWQLCTKIYVATV
jgi:hypothetical protein